jgi:hypothetical protein
MADHKTELREQTWTRSICVEPGCEYAGEQAVQGHCFHKVPDEIDRMIDHVENEAEAELDFYRQQHPGGGPEYVETLESMFLSVTMNWHSVLHEVIKLRAENARLTRPRADGPGGTA